MNGITQGIFFMSGFFHVSENNQALTHGKTLVNAVIGKVIHMVKSKNRIQTMPKDIE